jgi:hypothetical protein
MEEGEDLVNSVYSFLKVYLRSENFYQGVSWTILKL